MIQEEKMDIYKFINDQLNNQKTLEKLGRSVKAKPSDVQQVAQLGIPALLQALNRNATTEKGASSLAKALEAHENDDVDDIQKFLDKLDPEDAKKMLKHILADKNDKVQTTVAKKTGLKTDQVSGLMTQLAPLLMGALAQQKKQEQVPASGLAGLLGGIANNSADSGIMGMVSNLLDADDDGNIMDDVGGLLQGFLKK